MIFGYVGVTVEAITLSSKKLIKTKTDTKAKSARDHQPCGDHPCPPLPPHIKSSAALGNLRVGGGLLRGCCGTTPPRPPIIYKVSGTDPLRGKRHPRG